MRFGFGGALVAVCLSSAAQARRPDTGGDLHDFTDDDVLASVDSPSGRVRVHYSVSGPNATLAADADADGTPDLPQEVATTADAVLDAYTAIELRPPVSESALGLEPLGGSDAFDFYLVDFRGMSDGSFSVDACQGGRCAGHMLIDNDFREFDYPSVAAAIRVLASHEMFHAVQAAYTDDLPVWMSEGTATWAEQYFEPGVADFISFANAYLEDTARPIDRPPVGPVPAFAYGTALFFAYVSLVLGDEVIPLVLEATVDAEPLDAIESVLLAHDRTVSETLTGFAEANLNTGARTNDAAIYPYARRLTALSPQARGESIVADYRFYPLASSYWILNHTGGALYFGTADEASGVLMTLYSVDASGKLTGTVAAWAPQAGQVLNLGDVPEAHYWLSGAYPERAANSRKLKFCLGPVETLSECGLSLLADAGPMVEVDAAPPGAADAGSPDSRSLDAMVAADAASVTDSEPLPFSADVEVVDAGALDSDSGAGSDGCSAAPGPARTLNPALLAALACVYFRVRRRRGR